MLITVRSEVHSYTHVPHPVSVSQLTCPTYVYICLHRRVSSACLCMHSCSQPRLDPYANELVLPLGEFVRHPIARELLHDGQAFQVCCCIIAGM